MMSVGPLAFTVPWLLVVLAALPVLWLILRAVPPAPIRRRFPGVALLLGLTDDTTQTDRTPWWLLLLRMLAAAALIAGFAGPLLNPQAERGGTGPLLIVADGTWADARDWTDRTDRITALLSEAAREGRTTALVSLTGPLDAPTFETADITSLALPSFAPSPWEPDAAALADWTNTLDGTFDTFWLSDGLARDSRADMLTALQTHGTVTVFQTPRQTFALRPAQFADGEILLDAVRTPSGPPSSVEIAAVGLDPAGVERQLATVTMDFAPGDGTAATTLVLPAELRNRVTRFEIAGQRTAAAVTLTDDALKRREIALIAGGNNREGLELLSPLHYLREALSPSADLIEGTIADVLLANPDVIILADVAALATTEATDLRIWVENGGLLVRFAGPRLAASDVARSDEDPLLPVRLRAGGRTVGGAMSWGEPKSLAPFEDDSPFFGLAIPGDVTVTAQVMAQPDPTLAARVIAQLADGTPLVTRNALGQGSVVLFHVTANAEWSSLPLSGLFVQMLERLAVSVRPTTPTVEDLEGTTWVPSDLLAANGRLEAVDTAPGVAGAELARAIAAGAPGAAVPPGLYAGEAQRLALNVIGPETVLAPAAWPADVAIEGMVAVREVDLKGLILGLGLMLLLIDLLASMMLSGRLRGQRVRRTAAAVLVAVLAMGLIGLPEGARAQDSATTTPDAAEPADLPQDDSFAIAATEYVVLAHVLTGDARVDEIAAAGLLGLSQTLFQRTSIEPARPMAVNLETDDIALFPFLYWPMTPNQQIPSREAYVRLNRYLATGGMILFDTRDADTASFGSSTPEGQRLQVIARGLDIPPIAQIPEDHILTRSFYLIQDMPGRYPGRDIWVEAASPDAELAEGMPFRDLNDGVTPVIIGGNDWAAAWAIDDFGNPMLPVGRGTAGERQRELAFRFGVNLIMHVLTGNYKSDQVHVPALLERLGQ